MESTADLQSRMTPTVEGEIMVPKLTPPSSQPAVTHIHLDYEDGSSDEIRLLQGSELPLYGLQRKRPGEEARNLGAHTHGAIAAILFHTATTTERIEYSLGDARIRSLLARLFADPPSEGE
jgi:hypothetical protein